MKADPRMVEKLVGKKSVYFKRGPAGQRPPLVFPSLPMSVNPLFRLAHHTQFYFTLRNAWGGRK